ncbi:hypothetical protein MHU86_22702 [Fragilaria crotonensis]|nr:hypothetical protein MHU86_22702 [Fragilaria crotonensis]
MLMSKLTATRISETIAQQPLPAFPAYFSDMKLTNFSIALLVVFQDANVSGFNFLPSGESMRSHRASLPLSAQKKRKRKQPPGEPVSAMEVPSAPMQGLVKAQEDALSDDDVSLIKDVANFEFKPESFIGIGVDDASSLDDGNQFKLPDIRNALRKKEIEEEIARMEEQERESKPKIKRSDTKAFKKLLESNPFGDADDTLFEQEEYNAVSALLGERAKPFLGIPTGPIQVGHFIGALGIVLMAFVDYPGFPLTNLPTPVRECFQGGLSTVFGINAILALLSVFKASERGQPVILWVAKTFAVGGLAFDQLTQLPTLDEIKKSDVVKGKRVVRRSDR